MAIVSHILLLLLGLPGSSTGIPALEEHTMEVSFIGTPSEPAPAGDEAPPLLADPEVNEPVTAEPIQPPAADMPVPVAPITAAAVAAPSIQPVQPATATTTARSAQSGPTKANGGTTAARRRGGAGNGAAAAAGSGLQNGVRYRFNPAPEYPEEARRRRQEGVVLLQVEISVEGRPARIRVQRSSGVASLDEAAVRCVSRWQFEPARSATGPVASTVEVPVRFQLAR